MLRIKLQLIVHSTVIIIGFVAADDPLNVRFVISMSIEQPRKVNHSLVSEKSIYLVRD